MLEKKFVFVRALLCLVVALSFSATGALGDNILFIVHDPTLASYPNDVLIGDFLESLGHTVMYFDDNEDEAATEVAAAAADLVWISESVGSGNVANEITEIEVPIVVGEPYCWDEMGMTRGVGSTSDVATTDITIVSPGHFLAAGLSGTVTVLTGLTGSAGTAQFANGDAGDEATVIATATLADGQTYDVILVYEKGAALAVPPGDGSDRFAADIRIGMFFHYYAHDVLNDNAYALMEAAVKYVLGVKTQAKNVYYVDADATGNNDGSSWANAYVYLQDALADANFARKPVEIRVAQGTYTPDCGNGYVRGDKQAKFLLKSGVTIKGGFAGVGADDPNAWDHQAYETVLSGDLSGNDERLLSNFLENSDHVIGCIEGDASAVLDGFTITGGYATDRIGGGLLNYNANPTVRRCVFFDNYASQGGGMGNRYSSPTVSECTFSGNLAPHGGGGMYNDYGHPIVESCVFYDNWTWYLGGGGMYCGGSNPTITNCVFTDNGAPFGGGMYNAAANPTLINCTFSNNQGGAWGGGMQNDAGAKPRVTNCILWGDTPDEISFPGTADVTYSNVQGGWAGIGNINRDPKFADLEGRLSAGSPCIDAGNNDAVPSSITTDLNGNPRIINGTVDMGAYEFGGTTPSPPPGPSADPLSEALDTALSFNTGGSADWFTQTTTTRYGPEAAQSGDISHSQESWMQTTVSGTGTIKFYWKVSSEEDFDFLEFYIDGSLQDRISGFLVNWEQKWYTISTSGSHTLEWRYVKDGSGDSGSDCGWVDKVEWLTTP